nr:hypothetical protein [Caldimonas mangrovi]
MLLIDRLIEHGEQHVVVEADVNGQGLFVRDGAVPAWVGIEYMAQAISAWSGGHALKRGDPVPLGFLLGSRRMELHRDSFPCGSTLRIEARCELFGSNGLGSFECRILIDGDTAATAIVSVFLPDDAGLYLSSQESP